MFNPKPTTTSKLTKNTIGLILTERNNEIVNDESLNDSNFTDTVRDQENAMREKNAKVNIVITWYNL